MPKITQDQMDAALHTLNARVGDAHEFQIRGAGGSSFVLCTVVETENDPTEYLERRVGTPMSKPELLVAMDYFGRGYVNGLRDATERGV